jgi:hypothetical protein
MSVSRPLYHISRRLYPTGQIVQILEGNNDYSGMISAEGKDWVETALERLRPGNRYSRSVVQYAFDDMGSCLKFGEGEDLFRGDDQNSQWHLYEVEMTAPSCHPYELIDCIYWYSEVEEDEDLHPAIREYWRPTQEWKRIEYLAPEMTIIRLIPDPDPLTKLGATFKAASDRSLFKRLWPQLSGRDV